MYENRTDKKALDFSHPVLGEPVGAIGGQYVFTREARAEIDGREVLYYTGYYVLDRSCCGVGGCAYALVAGFVEDWKYDANPGGRPVSRVRPVTDEGDQNRISAVIRQADPYIQVSFLTTF